jgi:GTP pyrophosphokinase
MQRTLDHSFHDDFARALEFATRLHAGQYRKGTDIPYVAHLLAVASLVLEYDGGRDEAIAALLHDAVEDQSHRFPGHSTALRQRIRREFGDAVLSIVDGCTDADVMPKPPWRERKEAYIAHLVGASPSVRRVSCADKLHNARAIVADLRRHGAAVFDRFNGGRDGTLWYYDALAAEFLARGPDELGEELERTVREMHTLATECDRADSANGVALATDPG